ncbi:conjugal transfer protein [Nocardia sp. 2]|uniref:Conjugal transfer protein n=1 Tax=Nocardia acididurans TaxID=2802282 RepID=A0ABS1MGQ4_9NOCA|nr:conjugal transfer protein [Nocardia acididurans]MBL1079747.1 conjugal transfer protein [Nocardia acididurans]
MRTANHQIHETGSELLRRMKVRRRRDTLLMITLAVLATLGGGHAILEVFDTEPEPVIYEPPDITTGQAQLVGAFAQQFVLTYLSTPASQRDKLNDFLPQDQQLQLPAAGLQVSDPLVMYSARTITTAELDIWAVTVSVRTNRTTTANDSRVYYRVGVAAARGRLRALALPAVVNPPGVGRDLEFAYTTECTGETPLAQVVSGFLTAFLTGSGDIARYISIDASINVLTAPPFHSAELARLRSTDSSCGNDSASAQVLATVTPKSSGTDTAASLAFPLTVHRNGGQWQVVSIDPTPALANPLTVLAGPGLGTQAASPSTTTSSTAPIPPATQN